MNDLEKVALNAWVARLATSSDPDALSVWLGERDARMLEAAADAMDGPRSGDEMTDLGYYGEADWLRARAVDLRGEG